MMPRLPEKVDVLVVGGGPAGLATARSYRKTGGRGSVLIATEEAHFPYRRPALTKEFLRDPFPVDDLLIEAPSFFEQHEIEVALGLRVLSIDRTAHSVSTSDGSVIFYGDLVLTTGSEPTNPFGSAGSALVMRRIEDAQMLTERSLSRESCIVLGSGFIGCETAASLSMRGNDVRLVSMEDVPQCERLGHRAGGLIAGWLEELGIKLFMGVTVENVRSIDDYVVLNLGAGGELEADLLVLGAGVTPNADIAEAAGIATSRDRVKVDASMRSSCDDVWAAGDVALAFNPTAGRHLVVEHWGEALAQGEVAGKQLAGDAEASWDSVPGFWSTIGEHTVKYRAWGDGFDEDRYEQVEDGFVIRYGRDGSLVGVLAYNCDEAYEDSSMAIAKRRSL